MNINDVTDINYKTCVYNLWVLLFIIFLYSPLCYTIAPLASEINPCIHKEKPFILEEWVWKAVCLFVWLIHVRYLRFIRLHPYHILAVHSRLCTALTHSSNINEMFLSAVSRSACQKLQPADTDDGAQQCVHVWWRKTGSRIRATTFYSVFFSWCSFGSDVFTVQTQTGRLRRNSW